jgi:hypothetical protein
MVRNDGYRRVANMAMACCTIDGGGDGITCHYHSSNMNDSTLQYARINTYVQYT